MTVVPLHAANPGPMTGSGNWTYLLPGERPLLIDAGVGARQHLDALFTAVPGGPADVLVTHAHVDHASGAPAIRDRGPAACFLKYPWLEADAATDVAWQPVADGTDLASGSGPLRVVHTPGHSPDHVVLWHEASRTVFTGDLLVLDSTVVIPASRGGSLADYLASLTRVADLGPLRALPAHGPVIEDPLALIAHYRTHRRRREEQILGALDGGATTTAAIVARVYVGLQPALVPVAAESVLAHLLKLAGEGRVSRHGGRWRVVS